MPRSHYHAAAWSQLICVVNLANYQEGEVAWKIVRKSAAATAFFNVTCLRFPGPQVVGHEEDDHVCSALVHMCGEVWICLQTVGCSL